MDMEDIQASECDTSTRSAINNQGYQKKLHRGFNMFMSFTICFTNAAVIPSLFLQMEYGLKTGGPVTMLYGWIIVSIFTLIVGNSMAEICSTHPAAGSVYYWSGVLAREEYAPLFSYTCGWLNLLGNIAVNSSFAYGLANIISGLFTLVIGGQYWSQATTVMVSLMILTVWVSKCMIKIDHYGLFSDISGIYQIILSLAVVLSIFIMTPELSSTKFVTTAFNNQTGFEDGFYVYTIGILVSLYSFIGYEASATMAEETQNPNKSAPIGIISTIVVSSLVGFAMILGILYGCQENISFIIDGTNHSVVNFFVLVTLHKAFEAAVMILIVLSIAFLSGFSGMIVTSRVGYAIARDGGLPFSQFFQQLNPQTKNPDRILLLVFMIESLFCMLPLLSTTAFTAIAQVSTICLQLSYALPILLRITSAKKSFIKNTYHLGGFSILAGWISVSWLLSTSLIMLLPSEIIQTDGITQLNYNYGPIVLGIAFIIAALYWNMPYPYGAKYFFKGPIRIEGCNIKESSSQYEGEEQEEQVILQGERLLNYNSINFTLDLPFEVKYNSKF